MKALIFALAALLAGPHVYPQADPALVVDVDLVSLLFAVTDEDDRFLTGLGREDFEVFEDGARQEIRDFDAETDLPLTVAVIIDVSGSIREQLRFEQESAIEFFYSTIEPSRDKGMLVTFDSAVEVLEEFTNQPDQLAEAVTRIRAGGGTALYDALFMAIGDRMAAEEGRRVVILISDGDDNASRVSLTETLELAQRNDVAIYAISTNGTTRGRRSDDQKRGDRTLETFADETGGRAYFPFQLTDLAVNFREISEELRSQYVLTYVPTNTLRDGTYRRIEIRPREGDYQVKVRRGYYAPRD
jgi:VWFA-related protein